MPPITSSKPDNGQLFGELRSLLQQHPSASVWLEICALVEQLDEDFLAETALPYALDHLRRWDDDLRRARRRWFNHPEPPKYVKLARSAKLNRRGLRDRELVELLDSQAIRSVRLLDLSDNWIEAAGAAALARSTQLSALRELDLGHNQIKDAGFIHLCQAASLHALRSLRVTKNDLSPAALEHLAQAPFTPHLIALDLSNNWLRREAGASLATSPLDALERLKLDGNQLGDDGIKALLGERSSLLNLRELSLKRVGASAQGAHHIAWSAPELRLRHLDLEGNRVGVQGTRYLAESSRLTALESFGMRNTDLHDDVLWALADAPHLIALEHLDLSKNWLTARGMSHLENASDDTMPALTRLDLGSNQLEDTGAERLSRWGGLSKLRELNLRHADIGPNGAWALACALEHGAIEHLYLDNNALEYAGAAELCRLSGLKTLCLEHTRIDDHVVTALAESGALDGVRALYLAHNDLEDRAAIALAGCEGLEELEVLDLRYTRITTRGATALATSPYLSKELRAHWEQRR